MVTASWSLQRAASRRAALLGGGAAGVGARPDRAAGRRLRFRLRLGRRHRRSAAGVRARRRWTASRTRSTCTIPAARISDCLLQSRRAVRLQRQARHLSRHPAGLLGGRQSVPSPSGHQQAARAPWRGPRPSWCTSRGGPRPRATPTSCCRRPRRSSATTSAARGATASSSPCSSAIEPVGEARNDFAIFSELARRLGFAETYTQGRDEMAWLRHLYEQCRHSAGTNAAAMPDFDTFWQTGLSGNPGGQRRIRAVRRFPRRSREAQARARRPAGSSFIRRRSRASATTIARRIRPGSSRGNGSAARTPRPIRCIWCRASRATGCTARWIAGRSAPAARSRAARRSRSIRRTRRRAASRDGDVVRVHNARGACLAGAIVSDTVSAGVVKLSCGAWYDPADGGEQALCLHGNANVLTRDQGTSKLGQGPSSATALVEVERCTGAARAGACVRSAARVARARGVVSATSRRSLGDRGMLAVSASCRSASRVHHPRSCARVSQRAATINARSRHHADRRRGPARAEAAAVVAAAIEARSPSRSDVAVVVSSALAARQRRRAGVPWLSASCGR